MNVAGRYRLTRRIATGGMGTVYEGVDERLGRLVAVKVLKAEYADDPMSLERFSREARSAARLDHPNIAQIYDSGRDEARSFIVMEYVDGPHLGQMLETEGRLPPPQAVEIATQVCSALGAVHAVGIIHRDIKPGNVLLAPNRRVKVTDFGIAQAQGLAALTGTGTVLGTAHYLSPEQASSQGVTPASDVYAAGVLLYQLLTGSVPFEGDSPVAVALSHATKEVPPVGLLAPGVPPRLAAIVARATAKDPRLRFADGGQMAAELRATSASQPTMSIPVAPVPTAPASHVAAGSAHRRRSSVPMLAGLAGGGLLLAGLVALGVQVLDHDSSGTTADRAARDGQGSPRHKPRESRLDEARSDDSILPIDAIGGDAKELEKELKELGYDAQRVDIDSVEPKDAILATVLGPGESLTSGQAVLLIASKGKPPEEPSSFVVPSELIGADVEHAEEYLEEQDIEVEKVEIDSDGDQDGVVATYPGPGAVADSGTIVLIVAGEED